MKIAVFVHCFFPDHTHGTEVYTLELIRNLRDKGHEPVLITAKFSGEKQNRSLVTRTFFEGIPVFMIDKNFLPNRRIRDLYYQEEMKAPLKRILEEIRPDIAHVTHLLNHTAVLLEVLRKAEIPAIATFTDFFGICYNNKLEAAGGVLCKGPDADTVNCLECVLKERSRPNTASFADRLLAEPVISHLTAKALNQAYGAGILKGFWEDAAADTRARPAFLKNLYQNFSAAIAPTLFLKKTYESHGFKFPIHEIPYGVDLPRTQKATALEGSRVKFGFLGQIAEHKGAHIAVEAFCRLPKDSSELHIFGSAAFPNYLEKLSSRALGHAVTFHGNAERNQLAKIYSDLDFVIIPSTWVENCPFVLLESLAMQTPVIVSDVPGMSEFVRNGENGFLFPRGDAKALYDILNSIVSDPVCFRRLSFGTGYPRTSSQMTDETLEVYDSVLSGDGVATHPLYTPGV